MHEPNEHKARQAVSWNRNLKGIFAKVCYVLPFNNIKILIMKLNETFTHQFSFTQQQVDEFARVTGDYNPIHIDEKEAAKSIFKRRIMHGFLSGSVLSRVFGTLWPGKGTIYLSQQMRFVKPMYVDEVYSAIFKVVEVKSNDIFVIETSITNKENEVVLSGEAVIKYKPVL